MAIGGRAALSAFKTLGGAACKNRAQPGQQTRLHKALQAFGEFLAGAFVGIGLGQNRMVPLLEGVEHRVHWTLLHVTAT